MSLRIQKITAIAQDLLKEGILTSEKFAQVLEAQQKPENMAKDLGEILVESACISEKELYERLAKKAGTSSMSLQNFEHDQKIIKSLLPSQASRWRILPISETNGKLMAATSDPFNLAILDEARSELGRDIEYVLAPKTEIESAIRKYYGEQTKKPQNTASSPSTETVEVIGYESRHGSGKETPLAESQVSQVVAAVDQLFQAAIYERASDVHVEPIREGLKVRFRIDGVLEPVKTFPVSMQQAVLSRIKVMGGMDVAEHRVPQDGRTRLKIGVKEMDIRIATYPTMYGEAAAIRMLAKDSLITLEDLGFVGHDREVFEKLIHKPNGIFLVTGPTGSGKTSTLYTALQNIDRQSNHVLSVEDPVENEIEGVSQTQINARAGVTFPAVLRAMLREDPDVILVGEIRDQETADISLRAAMTGHLVFSTLHTNTAIGAIARLNDLGIETYLISSTLIGVLAQRLVRRLCENCKEEVDPKPEHVKALGPKALGLQAFRGRGCQKCENRGFKGRIGIYELIQIDEEFRVLVNNNAPEIRLRERAAACGSRSILEDGIEKIRMGITTTDEVLKVCGGH